MLVGAVRIDLGQDQCMVDALHFRPAHHERKQADVDPDLGGRESEVVRHGEVDPVENVQHLRADLEPSRRRRVFPTPQETRLVAFSIGNMPRSPPTMEVLSSWS